MKTKLFTEIDDNGCFADDIAWINNYDALP